MADSYRPANGTEGEWFESQWCARCVHDHEAHMDRPENGCNILARALVFGVDEPEYPAEWIYNIDQRPTCTAYKADKVCLALGVIDG